MMIVPRPILLLSYMLFMCFLEKIDAVIYSGPKSFTSVKTYKHIEPDYTIQKVLLTQKGYIQFLKYVTKVPTLTEYTFCIWVKSDNLTYNHPLLSYSRHEEERQIRVWISEHGKNLCLEILDHPIFKVEVNLIENTWYHVCQSWSAHLASWELYFNGRLRSNGFVPHLKGLPIAGGGDIVVGQEYTDFDKGLDDGVEGAVFGFNMVLSSTSRLSLNPLRRRRFDGTKPGQLYPKPLNIYRPFDVGNRKTNTDNGLNTRTYTSGFHPKRRFSRNIFQDVMNLFEAETQAGHLHNKLYTPIYNYQDSRRVSNDVINENPKPLGLLLVELSFDCGFKKGAPLSGKGVLVNWTKTPVRVFGGAILKKTQPFCRTLDSYGVVN